MSLAGALLALALTVPPPPPVPDVNWKLGPEQLAALCHSGLALARSRVKAALDAGGPAAPLDRLLAVETAVAVLDEAIVPIRVLGFSDDAKVRDAVKTCRDTRSAFAVEMQADPVLYAAATAAQASARSAANRMLAQRYAENGRRGGAGLDARARGELIAILDQIHAEEAEFLRVLEEDQAKATIEVSPEEAATLPASFAKTLKKTADGKGFLVPVGMNTHELVLKTLRPPAARERYMRAFYTIGGAGNVERLKKALALRREAARRLGYKSWAEAKLTSTWAKTPERVMTMLRELDAALLPRARAEVAELAALKRKSGEKGAFAPWDYTYYQAQLEQGSFAVDLEEVRQYFPMDVVIPEILRVFEELLGLRFEPLPPGSAWAPDVSGYALKDAASDTLLGWGFLDLTPSPYKFTRPASITLRVGRTLPGGERVLPISVVTGSGPSAAPGERALFTHQGVVDTFHEMGHMMHALLSAAPHASLSGTTGRADFVEVPSQLFEPWAWDDAILRRVSRHVRTGDPLPAAMAETLGKLRRVSYGVAWSRHAFTAAYDQELNGPVEVKDPTALWFERWAQMTALPALTGTIPEASLLSEMGGRDATYYSYIWSRVWALDVASELQKGGLLNPEVGMRYRRTVLEPGASAEPEALLQSFLGRPPRTDAFYRELGLPPPAGPKAR